MSKHDLTLRKLKKYLDSLKDFKGSKVTLIKSGHNRNIYLIQILNEKYVARVGFPNNDGGSSIATEVLVLRYLHDIEITFVPTVLLYNRKLNISIETFISKKHSPFKDYTKEQTSLFASQLAMLHKIQAVTINQFCKKNNFIPLKPLSKYNDLKIFGIDRFKKVLSTCPDVSVIKWIKPKLQKNIDTILQERKGKNINHLVWADIGDNILSKGKKLFFIDFEFARIGYSSELAYIKIHSHPTASIFRHLIKSYSLYSEIPETKLYEEISQEEKIIRVNDVIWAAMKWGECKNTELEKKYKELTFKRMKLYEKIQ